MKVILLQDVKSLGKKDQIVEVSDGYARNMLLPKKLGMEATSKNLNDLKLKKAHEDKVAAEVLADAQKNPEKYRSLLVRVAGYSAQFTNLSKEMQDSIMARNAHGDF